MLNGPETPSPPAMRIRKHAKISPLVYAVSSLKAGVVLQPHVCQLNQSPWDVITFSPPPSPPPSQVGLFFSGSVLDTDLLLIIVEHFCIYAAVGVVIVLGFSCGVGLGLC